MKHGLSVTLADLELPLQTRLASNSQKASSLCFLGAEIDGGHHLVQHNEDSLKNGEKRKEIKSIGTAFGDWRNHTRFFKTYYQLPVTAQPLKLVGV